MAEWFAKYPNDNGEYEITFKGSYTQAKEVEKVCNRMMDGKAYMDLINKDDVVFGELVLKSEYPYHIMAGKTRADVEKRISRKDGFLDLFPSAKYYPNGDDIIEAPHIKFNGNTIFTCGHSFKDSWEFLIGALYGAAIIYDYDLCDVTFYRELSVRTKDCVVNEDRRNSNAL